MIHSHAQQMCDTEDAAVADVEMTSTEKSRRNLHNKATPPLLAGQPLLLRQGWHVDHFANGLRLRPVRLLNDPHLFLRFGGHVDRFVNERRLGSSVLDLLDGQHLFLRHWVHVNRFVNERHHSKPRRNTAAHEAHHRAVVCWASTV